MTSKHLSAEGLACRYSSIALYLIGAVSLLNSIASNHFSKLHIISPVLNLPIFPGEVLLFLCFILLALKWKAKRPQWNRFYLVWVVYFVWVLGNAFYGYSIYGPLAFRNAALFYYPFFIFLGMEFYHASFFSQKKIIFVLIVFLLTGFYKLIGLFPYYTYYNYSYLMLYAVLFLKLRNKTAKIIFLFGFLVVIHYHVFFLGSRAALLSFLSAVGYFTIFLLFGVLNIKKQQKLLAIAGVFLILVLGIMKFGAETKVNSLLKISAVKESYLQMQDIIDQRGKDFQFQPLEAKLYNEEGYDFVEEKQDAPLIQRAKVVEGHNQKINEYLDGLKEVLRKKVKDNISKSQKEDGGDQGLQNAAIAAEVEKINDAVYDSLQSDIRQITDSLLEKLPGAPSYVVREVMTDAQKNIETKMDKAIETANTKISEILPDVPVENNSNDGHVATVREAQLKDDIVAQVWRIGNRAEAGIKTLEEEYNNILFRYFIWRDMAGELIEKKAVFGVNWGQPQRSRSIEILGIAYGEWTRDGWITPHNSFFHILYRAGIFGFGLIIALFASLVQLTKNFIKLRSKIGILICSTFVFWLMISNFLVILEFPHNAIPLWTLYGLTWAYCLKELANQKASQNLHG